MNEFFSSSEPGPFGDTETTIAVDQFLRQQMLPGILELLRHHSSETRAECLLFVCEFVSDNVEVLFDIVPDITNTLRHLRDSDPSELVRFKAAAALDQIVERLVGQEA